MVTRRTALITGASGGIGLELARLFAQDGYDCVLVARGKAALNAVAADLTKRYGVSATARVQDLGKADSAAKLVDALARDGIAIDALVNNAGFASYGLFHEIDDAEQLSMMQTNMVTLTMLTRLLLPAMITAGHGQILNVASTAAFQPGPLMAVYYASKAYVLSFSEAIANELAGTGVTVTALCPGPTATGFQKRAAMEDSKLVAGRTIMDARTVARAGYRGLKAGKTIVVPGFRNQLITQAARITPRSLMTRMVRSAQEKTQPGQHAAKE